MAFGLAYSQFTHALPFQLDGTVCKHLYIQLQLETLKYLCCYYKLLLLLLHYITHLWTRHCVQGFSSVVSQLSAHFVCR